jgi:hypothetical protein
MAKIELSKLVQHPTHEEKQESHTAFVKMYQGGVRVWGIEMVYDDLFEALERIYPEHIDCSLPLSAQMHHFFTADGILSHDLCVSIVTILEEMGYKVEPRDNIILCTTLT